MSSSPTAIIRVLALAAATPVATAGCAGGFSFSLNEYMQERQRRAAEEQGKREQARIEEQSRTVAPGAAQEGRAVRDRTPSSSRSLSMSSKPTGDVRSGRLTGKDGSLSLRIDGYAPPRFAWKTFSEQPSKFEDGSDAGLWVAVGVGNQISVNAKKWGKVLQELLSSAVEVATPAGAVRVSADKEAVWLIAKHASYSNRQLAQRAYPDYFETKLEEARRAKIVHLRGSLTLELGKEVDPYLRSSSLQLTLPTGGYVMTSWGKASTSAKHWGTHWVALLNDDAKIMVDGSIEYWLEISPEAAWRLAEASKRSRYDNSVAVAERFPDHPKTLEWKERHAKAVDRFEAGLSAAIEDRDLDRILDVRRDSPSPRDARDAWDKFVEVLDDYAVEKDLRWVTTRDRVALARVPSRSSSDGYELAVDAPILMIGRHDGWVLVVDADDAFDSTDLADMKNSILGVGWAPASQLKHFVSWTTRQAEIAKAQEIEQEVEQSGYRSLVSTVAGLRTTYEYMRRHGDYRRHRTKVRLSMARESMCNAYAQLRKVMSRSALIAEAEKVCREQRDYAKESGVLVTPVKQCVRNLKRCR